MHSIPGIVLGTSGKLELEAPIRTSVGTNIVLRLLFKIVLVALHRLG